MTGPEQSGKGADGDATVDETGSNQVRDEQVDRLDDSEIVGGLGRDADQAPEGERSGSTVASADDADRETVVDSDDDDSDDDIDDDINEDDDGRRDGPGRGVFLATLGVAVAAVLGVLVLVGAYIWPAFLGPGSPEGVAQEAVSALQNQNSEQMATISCVRMDGQASAEFPPELMALISGTTPAGPPSQTLDTEARAPVDLTVAAGGPQQGGGTTLPIDLLFGVDDNGWCLNGVAQRQ